MSWVWVTVLGVIFKLCEGKWWQRSSGVTNIKCVNSIIFISYKRERVYTAFPHLCLHKKNPADNLCHHLHSQSLKVRKNRLKNKSEKVFSELRSTVSNVFIEVQLAWFCALGCRGRYRLGAVLVEEDEEGVKSFILHTYSSHILSLLHARVSTRANSRASE